jgi:hypothetical protein
MKKVWTYVISKQLGVTELDQLLHAGKTFVSHWTAHEHKLSANFEIHKKRIIVVTVNEDVNDASGCSIDKLTRFIKITETMFGVELLNRLLVAYQEGEEINVVHASRVKELLEQKVLSADTIVYNTTISTGEELENWEQPLKSTWLNKYMVTA